MSFGDGLSVFFCIRPGSLRNGGPADGGSNGHAGRSIPRCVLAIRLLWETRAAMRRRVFDDLHARHMGAYAALSTKWDRLVFRGMRTGLTASAVCSSPFMRISKPSHISH